MDEFEQMLVVAISTFLAASGGFWIYLKKRISERDAGYKLLLGLTHYKIVELGMEYISKGFVSKDEYDDLVRYFWEPYVELGGNGSAERIMHLVQRLPLTLSNSRIANVADMAKVRAEDERRIREIDTMMNDFYGEPHTAPDANELERRKRESEERDEPPRRADDLDR